MDDPGLAWPFWKFGLKKDDLFSTLHDQYNTFPSTIQDPEAFHHDVFEISQEAESREEFYRLLRFRREQRLRELNEGLESAAVEIIANPALVGTEQWQYALQLFRTKSLDSLVRYFSSYIPEDHSWHAHRDGGSYSDTSSSVDSIANSNPSLFDDLDDGPEMTDEPMSMSAPLLNKKHIPLSPRSMAADSDSSAASVVDLEASSYIFGTLTPARSLSFSESESERLPERELKSSDDDTSLSSSISDISDLSKPADAEMSALAAIPDADLEAEDEDFSQAPTEVSELGDSETPTPKPMASGSSFFEAKPSSSRRHYRSISPSRSHPLALVQTPDHDARQSEHLPILRRREACFRLERRSLGKASHRVRKPSPDCSRSRYRGRKLLDA